MKSSVLITFLLAPCLLLSAADRDIDTGWERPIETYGSPADHYENEQELPSGTMYESYSAPDQTFSESDDYPQTVPHIDNRQEYPEGHDTPNYPPSGWSDNSDSSGVPTQYRPQFEGPGPNSGAETGPIRIEVGRPIEDQDSSQFEQESSLPLSNDEDADCDSNYQMGRDYSLPLENEEESSTGNELFQPAYGQYRDNSEYPVNETGREYTPPIEDQFNTSNEVYYSPNEGESQYEGEQYEGEYEENNTEYATPVDGSYDNSSTGNEQDELPVEGQYEEAIGDAEESEYTSPIENSYENPIENEYSTPIEGNYEEDSSIEGSYNDAIGIEYDGDECEEESYTDPVEGECCDESSDSYNSLPYEGEYVDQYEGDSFTPGDEIGLCQTVTPPNCMGQESINWIVEGLADEFGISTFELQQRVEHMLQQRKPPQGMSETIDQITRRFALKAKMEKRLFWMQSKGINAWPLNKLFLSWEHYHARDIDEARRLLVWIVQGITAAINMDGWRHPALGHYPLDAYDLTIEIRFDNFFGEFIDRQYVQWVRMHKGLICYQAYNCWYNQHGLCWTRRERWDQAAFQVQIEKEAGIGLPKTNTGYREYRIN
jgi:hypothetical protein